MFKNFKCAIAAMLIAVPITRAADEPSKAPVATMINVTDPSADVTDATRDMTRVAASQEADGNLVVTVVAKAPSDFTTMLVFLNTDGDTTTGFRPSAAPELGFEWLISGEQLLKHTGETRDAWTWQNVAPVKRAVAGDTITLTFSATVLKTASVELSVWTMSPDWLTLVDRAPDGAPAAMTVRPTAPPATKPAALMAPPKENRNASARQRVKDASSYYCYYGSGKVEELSHYDVVVLHTPQMKREDVKRLRDNGVVTIGYISVGESEPPTPKKGDGTGPGGFASFYFDKNGDDKPDMNPIWFSYYTNAGDPNWRADRVTEARRLVEEYGFDGIFLDTIDTAMMNPESASGMVQLVQEFRAALPDAPIVLNQGFPLLPQLAPLADALMLESFTATYDFDSKTYMMNYPQSIDYHLTRTQKDILPVLKNHPLRVMVLDYAPESETARIQEAANRAATFGFLFAVAPINLDAVYANSIVGKPDPKWLNKMTTPELLSYTLPQPVNGLPAGTVVMPSSAFAGYKVDSIVDGVADRAGMHWSKAAWASNEDGEEAWIELRLPESRSAGTLKVNWELSHPSRAFAVQVKSDLASNWTDVAQVKDNTAASVSVPMPAEPYRVVRIRQAPGDGSPNRPDLMWVAQVYLN